MTEALHTERLILRRPAARDADRATAFYMSDRSHYSGGRLPRPKAWMMFSAMLGHWQVRDYGLWAVTTKEDDTILGLVGPFYPAGWPEHEIGWVVFDGAEGHGYAYEAATAARDHARSSLGWTDIVSYIQHENRRSIALAERLGAVQDPSATIPNPEKPVLVYRHPQPEHRS